MKENQLFKPRWAAIIVAFSFLCLLIPRYAAAQLSGTYTINASNAASSTNYQTFSSAVSDMISGTRADGGTAYGPGVSGPVTFNVASGTYSEQVSISAISGASALNRITFQSAAGDSSKVILTSASSSSSTNNYTLNLSGAKYLTFKKISITRTGSAAYAIVVALNSGANYNQFFNNLVIGKKEASTTTTGFTGVLNSAFGSTGNDSNNLFQNNRVIYGTNGFYFATYASGNSVVGNIMDTAGVAGVYALFQTDFLMENNLVRLGAFPSSSNHYVSYCLRLQNSPSPKIIKNKFYNTSTATVVRAIVLFDNTSTSTNPGLLANNFILVTGGTTSSTGISLAGNSYLNIYYNNVLNTGTLSGGSAFHVYPPTQSAGSNNNVVNNNFIHKGGRYAADISGNTSGIGVMDYNNLYTTGTLIGNWNGTTYSSLSAWQSASGKDSHSVSVDPAYVSTLDLHTTSSAINGKATPLASVTNDIDYQTRNSSTPDIGADEFTPATLDAGITIVDSPTVFCSGTKNVVIKFANYGDSTLKSLTINWSINGTAQTPYNWTGSVIKGNSSSGITLGSFSFAANTNYAIKVWTSNPNSGTDANAANDTLVANRISALNGTYTIGSTSPSFTSFNNAISAMSTRGVCGPVTFNVRDGVYTEQVSVPQLPGVNAINTVTWQSQSNDSTKVNLTYTSAVNPGVNNATLQLNGADYHIFKKMTISRTGTLNLALVIDIKSGAHNNKFLNNRLIGIQYGSLNADADIVSSVGDKDTGNVFQNNYMKNGNVAFRLIGSSTAYENGNIIQGNIVDSAFAGYVIGQYTMGIQVLNNTFTNLRSGTSSVYGINLSQADGPTRILRNKLTMPLGGYAGLYITSSSAKSSDPALIANNFVSVASGSSITNPYGIYLSTTDYHNIYYNSVNIYNTNTTGAAFYASSSTGGNNNLRNNNFVNTGGGYAIYNGVAAFISASDYNNLFTTGNIIGYWGSTSAANLAAWRTASSKDANSVSVNPLYTSATDFHTRHPLLNGKATPLSIVTVDIDNETRNSSTPDIGADEFELVPNDAGISAIYSPVTSVCAGSRIISVTIKNFAKDTLKSAEIAWSMNGVAQTSFNWTGKLATDSSRNVNIGSFNFTTGPVTIKAWTKSPNSSTDPFAFNDTSSTKVTVNPVPTATVGSAKTICLGQNANIGSAPMPGNSYSWTSKPAGFTSTSSGPSVSPSVTTVYYLTETISSTGCSKTDSVTVTVNPLPKAITGNDTAICAGSSINIGSSAITGNTYSWTSVPSGFTSTAANPLVNSSVTTTYILTEKVTSTGCSKTDSVTITINSLPKAITGNDTAICGISNISLGAAPVSGNTYSWTSIPAGFTSSVANPKVNVFSSSTFVLTETVTATGCSKTDSVRITVNQIPRVNLGSASSVCEGNSVQIGPAPVKGYIYKWTSFPAGFTSSIANPFVSPTKTTGYALTVIDSSTGCTHVDSMKITVNPAPAANAGGSGSLCEGKSVQLGAAAVTGNTYSWTSIPAGFSSTVSNPTVKPSVTTTYYLTETITSTGCSKTDSVTVTVNPLANANAGADRIVCNGGSTQIGDSAISGNFYSWVSIPAGFSSTVANPVINPSVTTKYILTVTSNLGCDNYDTVTVTVVPNPSALITGSPSVCAGSTVTYTTPSVSGISYSWSVTGGTIVSGQNTDSATIQWSSTAGTGSVKVIATSSLGGCTDTADVNVNIVNPPVVHWSVTQGSGRTFNFAPSDTSFASYVWNFGDGDTSTSLRPTHTYQVDTTYSVSLTVRTKEGCEVTKDSTLSIVTGIVKYTNPFASFNIYPNPFKDVTTLKYTLTEKAKIQVNVYDITGREIANLENATQTPGNYQYQFDANKYNANAGVYFVKVVVGDKLVTRQIVNVK